MDAENSGVLYGDSLTAVVGHIPCIVAVFLRRRSMLRELLALLSEGKTLSQYDLAERLNTTPQAIAAHLDFLHRAGYLRKVCAVKNCGKQCAGCLIESASPESVPVIWEMAGQ
jgi:biotin operon repressor